MKFAVAFALAACSFLACSSESGDDDTSSSSSGSSGHAADYPTCQIISDACHALDTGDPGPVHDCHEVAHGATSDEPCVAKKDECLALCHGDGGAHDHEH